MLQEVVLDSSAIARAKAVTSQQGTRNVLVRLTAEGKRKAAKFTAANIGRRLAIIWRGRVLCAPVIQTAITSEELSISGIMTEDETQQLLDALNQHESSVTPTNTGSFLAAQPLTPEQLAEPPRLRFLAWQDEYKTNHPGAARHPDGSPVTDPTELNWSHQIQPSREVVTGMNLKSEPRFLHLWFSHPAFDPKSFCELALLDGAGKPLPLGTSIGVGYQEPNNNNGNLAGSHQP